MLNIKILIRWIKYFYIYFKAYEIVCIQIQINLTKKKIESDYDPIKSRSPFALLAVVLHMTIIFTFQNDSIKYSCILNIF